MLAHQAYGLREEECAGRPDHRIVNTWNDSSPATTPLPERVEDSNKRASCSSRGFRATAGDVLGDS